MLSAFSNTFKIPELRKRILFTLGLVFAVRLVAIVPVPGVDTQALQALMAEMAGRMGGGLLGLVDMFSGGALSNCAIGALGIMPYISASIIIQLMTAVIPALEKLVREGDSGRQKITQYTRYLTLALCVVQAFFMATAIENPQALTGSSNAILVPHPGMAFRLMTVITMTTGTMLIMWLGEQITARGIGNGISLIITIGIVSRIPNAIQIAVNLFKHEFNLFMMFTLLIMLVLVVMGTILLTQGQRKIPIQYAKRVVGRKVYGGQNTFMPLRVNYSGVMPIIFAQAILMFPAMLLSKFTATQSIGEALTRESNLYLVLFGGMILFFSYFWVSTQFNPVRIADDLKKYGGYVPGIRPGRPTAEFLDFTMTRITLAGALFLTVIAVFPTLLYRVFAVPQALGSFFGGTSLLIVVGVVLDTMRQVESHLLMRHYDGFLTKGKLHGRR
jgi:preprotein translocase subunit SecY